MEKEVFTERHIEDAAYLNCPSVENEADWIYGFIAGGKYVKKHFESELEKIIKVPDVCLCTCKNKDIINLVFPLPPICNNCRKMIRRSFYNAT